MLNARMRIKSLIARVEAAIEAWFAPVAPEEFGYAAIHITDDHPYTT